MSRLDAAIKRTAVEAVLASKPVTLVIGKVTSIEPLQITVEQRLPLDEELLVLTKNVQDHYVDIEVNHWIHHKDDENITKTNDIYIGKKKVLMKYGLKQGESVLLIKMQGGQKYIVLDRIGEIPTEGEWV